MSEAKKRPARPFFARFLEEQELEAVRGAGNFTSKRGKLDWDDSLPSPTLKYPSDDDEVRYPGSY